MKVCFIDDCFAPNGNKPRVDQINLLGACDDIVAYQILPSKLREWHDENPIELDLIFIDYKLQEDQAANDMFQTGSEIVSLVRKLFPDTPLYLLSVEIDKTKEYERAEGFERNVGENYLSHTKTAYQDVLDHVALKSVIAERDIEKLLIEAFKAPSDIKEDLKNAIPGSIRKYFLTTPKNHENHEKINIGPRVGLYRWFIDLLYKYPGFLLNEDACALYLGISVDYFNSISSQFNEALYSGIFSDTFERRWWRSKIEDKVIEADENNFIGTDSFSNACARILGATQEDLALCAYCGKGSPEELAVTDDTTDSTLLMVHTRCSKLDIDFNVGPYFSKPRIVETK